MTFQNMSFDASTVPRRIRFGLPWRAIFFDLDGTLTGKGANSYATYYRKIHEVAECETKQDEMDGVVCDNRV